MEVLASVIGKFPPPIDGQAMATARLAAMLAEHGGVQHIPLFPQQEQTSRRQRLQHYIRVRHRVRQQVAMAPDAPVLWAMISPHVVSHWRDWLTVVPAFQPRQRVYAISHWGNFDRLFTSPWTRRSAQRLIDRLEGLVFLDESLADRCAAWVPDDKRIVIPNTIDAEVIPTAREIAAKQAQRDTSQPLRILYLSNMIASKGYGELLEAVGMLQAQGTAVDVRFIGRWLDGDDAERTFRTTVAARGLQDIVHVLGPIRDRAVIKQHYLDADVFCLPTYYPTEAQPLAILEALSAGTPVVSTRHAGIPNMVTDGTEGRLVQPRDATALAHALARFVEPGVWQQASQAARSRFQRQFSPIAVGQRWLDLVQPTLPEH
ncbi:MAG: glycosyltransferase family 4 protein [Bacteroidota bacterium]